MPNTVLWTFHTIQPSSWKMKIFSITGTELGLYFSASWSCYLSLKCKELKQIVSGSKDSAKQLFAMSTQIILSVVLSEHWPTDDCCLIGCHLNFDVTVRMRTSGDVDCISYMASIRPSQPSLVPSSSWPLSLRCGLIIGLQLLTFDGWDAVRQSATRRQWGRDLFRWTAVSQWPPINQRR